jgi:hypothetical protein
MVDTFTDDALLTANYAFVKGRTKKRTKTPTTFVTV